MTPDHPAEPQASRSPSEPTPEQREAFLDHLRIYLAAMYPSASYRTRRRLIRRARNRGHYGRLGEVAGILVSNYVRHELTDYDRLLRINGAGEGLTREEARLVVAQEVEDMANHWRQGSAETDEGYLQLRRLLREKRRKKGKRKDNAGVIGTQNAALAEYLKGWLERRQQGREEREDLAATAACPQNCDAL